MICLKTRQDAEEFLLANGFSKNRDDSYSKYTRSISDDHYAFPRYKIQKYKNGWGIRVKYYYAMGVKFKLKDGRVKVLGA
jgi:hypothetical protein